MAEVTLIVPTLSDKTVDVSMAGCAVDVLVMKDLEGAGFTRTVNYGLRQVKTLYVAIMSDDCEPKTNFWLANLLLVLELDPTFGFVCPSMPCRIESMKDAKVTERPSLLGVDSVSFGCVVFPRKIISRVGYLDPSFRHYASDTDYQMRARHFGYVSVWAQHVYVHREMHDPIVEWWEKDRKRFYERYGFV